jgi:hypothetical protein
MEISKIHLPVSPANIYAPSFADILGLKLLLRTFEIKPKIEDFKFPPRFLIRWTLTKCASSFLEMPPFI